MSYTGTVQNGRIVLTPEVILPEGTQVTVITAADALYEGLPDWADEMVKLAKPRDWPEGYARNLDRHLTA